MQRGNTGSVLCIIRVELCKTLLEVCKGFGGLAEEYSTTLVRRGGLRCTHGNPHRITTNLASMA